MRISLLETSLQKKTFFLRIWTLTSELVVGQINIILFFLYIVQTSLRSVSAPELQRSTHYNTSALTVTIITWRRVVPV